MTGETNPEKLPRSMTPVPKDGTFVSAHVPDASTNAGKECCVQFF
jgi:hypothetical protein